MASPTTVFRNPLRRRTASRWLVTLIAGALACSIAVPSALAEGDGSKPSKPPKPKTTMTKDAAKAAAKSALEAKFSGSTVTYKSFRCMMNHIKTQAVCQAKLLVGTDRYKAMVKVRATPTGLTTKVQAHKLGSGTKPKDPGTKPDAPDQPATS